MPINIYNLTESYIENVISKNQPDKYIQDFPELFDHYFKYWCSVKHFNSNISVNEVTNRTERILNKLPQIEAGFSKNDIELKDIDIILFVGNNASNGHAFNHNNKFKVWIPIETYTSDVLIDVFLSHEIVHSINYSLVPELYFNTVEEQTNTARQLISEGISTFISMIISKSDEKTALWADYLLENEIEIWHNDCENTISELAQYVLENFNKSIPKNILFTINNKSFGNRRGYYIGLKIAEILYAENDKNINNLLSLGGSKAEVLTKQILRNLKD